MENYFDTLSQALDAVTARCTAQGAQADAGEWSSFMDKFCIGGVAYGETKTATVRITVFKNKPTNRRALTASIYRMESGRYELTAYIA